ncbi:MAG: hypothetical protein ACC656_02195 [Candidatus Heimdallarchaeota archaeon]
MGNSTSGGDMASKPRNFNLIPLFLEGFFTINETSLGIFSMKS